ncbi:MAG: serine/threonine protein kinase [Myxococcaceae bacterium]|nr:serine/threonine protein kinase [Myxococcaceae bacterium]
MTVHLDPDNLPAGTLVDGWRVVRRLGGGAYGTVYQVEKGGDFFALKIARCREQSGDARHTDERAQRELACLLALRHRYIARAWGHGRWPHPREGFFYVVMDYVEGYTLAEWQERTRATPREVVVFFEKVFEAVASMHGQGIFHRDLKPGNLLVRARDGEPVVVDYGVAHFPVPAVPQLTDTHLPPGTPRYTSPEAQLFVARHRHDKAARYEFQAADELYALGVTLYDVLTDPQPWSNPQPLPVSNPHVPPTFAHEENGRVPVALSHFTARLLAREPASRPVSVEAARRDLVEFLRLTAEEWGQWPLHPLPPPAETEPAHVVASRAAAVPQEEPHAKPLHRRWGFTTAAGAVGLCALLACGAYLVLRGAAPAPAEPPPSPLMAVEPPPPSSPPPAAVPVDRVPAGAPSAEPAPASPDLVSTQEERSLVKPAHSQEKSSPSLCSQKIPPPRGTPEWRTWCKCASIVGTLAAFQAGCSGPQMKPTSPRCTEDALNAMRMMRLLDILALDTRAAHPIRGEGPVTFVARDAQHEIEDGTLLSGYLWIKKEPEKPEGRALVRLTQAQLPDGTTFPVCFETEWYIWRKSPGGEFEGMELRKFVPAPTWRETGDL